MVQRAETRTDRADMEQCLSMSDTKGQLHKKELSQGYEKTTNNRMELMAVIAGLEALNRSCEVEVYSDSTICCECV